MIVYGLLQQLQQMKYRYISFFNFYNRSSINRVPNVVRLPCTKFESNMCQGACAKEPVQRTVYQACVLHNVSDQPCAKCVQAVACRTLTKYRLSEGILPHYLIMKCNNFSIIDNDTFIINC